MGTGLEGKAGGDCARVTGTTFFEVTREERDDAQFFVVLNVCFDANTLAANFITKYPTQQRRGTTRETEKKKKRENDQNRQGKI